MCFLVVPAVAICSGLMSAFGTGAGEGRTSLRAFATYIGTGAVEGIYGTNLEKPWRVPSTNTYFGKAAACA